MSAQYEAFVKEIQGALVDLGTVPVPDGLPELARAVRDRLEKLEAVAAAARGCIEVLEPLERDLWPSQEAAAVALRDALAALVVSEQKEVE